MVNADPPILIRGARPANPQDNKLRPE